MTSGDSSCYAATSVTDANAHQSQTFSDAYGRTAYTRDLSGNGGTGSPPIPYATYRTLAATYDYAGNATAITQPNGSTTTFGYDDAGRQLAMTDPDRGHESYTYDANGNVLQATDARNSSVYAGYDGLNRQLWRNSSDTPSGAYVTYSYDETTGGHGAGIGRQTSETFASPTDPSLTGSYSYSYDARGQITNSATTLLGTSYPTATTYDDAGEPLTLTYPDGAVASSSYSQGWLAGVSWTQHSATTPLLAAVSYSGASGAFGAITSATVGQSAGAALYHTTTQLDNDGRPTTTTLSRVSDGATLFNERLSYDPVGNVSAVSTTLPAGTDHQLFCYDEQNRLTWAGTTSGNPCGNPATTGSFGGAGYTQGFGYDTLGRLTSGTLGSYTYGDASHLHAATAISNGYTASYDASGDMTCRAPSSSTTCSGTQTGAQLGYNNEGQLTTWQDAPSSPRSTDAYLYDGEGNRVVQQVADSPTGSPGTTTTTSYIGRLETVTSDGTTTTTTDYAAAGSVLAESVNGTLSYLVTTYQGSVVEALDGSGVVGVTASQLYAPYGGVRYASGTMPTDYGYTGQRADASTGLDYYGARYYDPTLGQFTSADTLLAGGLNRYGYAGGNPTTFTDPSGHMDDYQIASIMGGGGFRGGSFGDFGLDLDLDMSTIQYAFDDDGNLVTFDGDNTVTTLYGDGTTESMDSDTWLQQQGQEDQDFQDSLAIGKPGTNYYGEGRGEGEETGTPTTTPGRGGAGTTGDGDGGDGTGVGNEGGTGNGGPPGSGGGDANGGSNTGGTDGDEVTDEDLYAFGGSPNGPNPWPRGPRASTDIDVDSDGMVSVQDPMGEVQGASTYTDPNTAPLSGHYYRLPAGTRLPQGLRVHADGADVGGPAPWGHRTIYPTKDMPFETFFELFRKLGWIYGGKS